MTRSAAVVGRPGAPADDLARDLIHTGEGGRPSAPGAGRGHVERVVLDDPDQAGASRGWVRAGDREGLVAALERVRGEGTLDLVVHVAQSPAALAAGDVDALEDSTWIAAAEDPVWETLVVLQAARSVLRRDGVVVVVVADIALVGAAGVTAASTAAEGVRALVKSAARAWGPAGFYLHVVAARGQLLGLEADGAPSMRPPAYAEPTMDDLAAAVWAAAALSPGVGSTTLVVDGGRTVLP